MIETKERFSHKQSLVLLGVGAALSIKAAAMFGVPIPISSWVAGFKGAVSAGGIMKGTGAAVAVGAMFAAHQALPATQTRKKLLATFEEAGLYRTSGKRKVYPHINRVTICYDRIEMVFTVPFGVDPEKVENSRWLFEQMFPGELEIEHTGRNHFVTVYFQPVKAFPYNYEEIAPLIAGMRLPIVVGRSRKGWIVYDAGDNFANLLIAGTNGSGKSSQIRSILTTLIKYKKPDDIRLYLADLKHSEFGIFEGIQHVDEVVYTKREVVRILKYLREEIDRRGIEMRLARKQHIKDVPGSFPILVLFIDEVAVLNLKKEPELAQMLIEISALGRAADVQIFYSMQRPCAETLSTPIKTNLNVRMGFRAVDETNSRIILDDPIASTIPITRKGEFYFMFDGYTKCQAPWLGGPEAEELIAPYIVSQSKTIVIDRSQEKTEEVHHETAPFNPFEVIEGEEDEATRQRNSA